MGTLVLDVRPLGASFGAVVRGTELRTINEMAWRAIHDAWLEYALLIFPGQFLTREDQFGFASRFGEVEFECPFSNIDECGRVHFEPSDDVVDSLRDNEGWHHDSSYMPVLAKGAVVTAEVVPDSGSATGWADMRAAYEVLDAGARAEVRGHHAYHSMFYSQGRAKCRQGTAQRTAGTLAELKRQRIADGVISGRLAETALRPLVTVHPDTGRPNLLIGRHAFGIPGLDADDSECLLDRLVEDACQPPRVYFHQWEVGDTVVWDNRRLMHRATPFDLSQPRRIWHTRIAGDPAFERAIEHV
jgi:alpha-ketoglutarate-dependent taurine dioxygenase